MHSKRLAWAGASSNPLVEHLCFADSTANTVVVGTGQFRAGQDMPEKGFSQYPMREISIVLEGAIETESEGKTLQLRAGDIVTIPPNQMQRSRFLENTKLIYVFFGHRAEGEESVTPST